MAQAPNILSSWYGWKPRPLFLPSQPAAIMRLTRAGQAARGSPGGAYRASHSSFWGVVATGWGGGVVQGLAQQFLGVDADEIEQLHRAHRIAHGGLDRQVDVGRLGHAL